MIKKLLLFSILLIMTIANASEPVIYIEIKPDQITLAPGQTQHFVAVGYNKHHVKVPFKPLWRVEGKGKISPDGHYTAGNNIGDIDFVKAINPITKDQKSARVLIRMPKSSTPVKKQFVKPIISQAKPVLLIDMISNESVLLKNDMVTYIIEVTNMGVEPGRNIRIRCEFPAEINPIEAKGDTSSIIRGNRVEFKPYPVLQSKQKITYRISAKGVRKGLGYVKAYIDAESFPRELIRETKTLVVETEKHNGPLNLPVIDFNIFNTNNPLFLSSDNESMHIIEITNAGTALDKNITVQCEFPAEINPIKAEAIINSNKIIGTIQGQKVFFSYPVLHPAQKIVFLTTIRGVKCGYSYIKSYISTTSLGKILNETIIIVHH